VEHPALGDKSQIYLLPFHIKIGLIKICMKEMNKENEGFAYLRQNFLKFNPLSLNTDG